MNVLPEAPNRRAVLGYLALANAPLPYRIEFGVHPMAGNTLWLSLASGADVRSWATRVGLVVSHPHRTTDGKDLIITASGGVNGWWVTLWATDAVDEHLETADPTESQRLQSLVDAAQPADPWAAEMAVSS